MQASLVKVNSYWINVGLHSLNWSLKGHIHTQGHSGECHMKRRLWCTHLQAKEPSRLTSHSMAGESLPPDRHLLDFRLLGVTPVREHIFAV